MNAIRSILVHLDAGPRGAVRLQTARALADRFGAAVTALYAVTPVYVQVAPQAIVGSAAEALLALDEERADAARKLVARVNAEPGVTVQWRETSEYGFAREALYADLLVLGQHDQAQSDTGVRSDFVQSVLMASGKPALLVPYIAKAAPRLDTILVAWKETREAARALSAALPLLQQAKAVHVAVDAEATDRGMLQQYLQRQGIEARCHTLTTQTAEAGELLLSMAADVGAHLMVMGCYGHSRAREFLLGGASRSVLEAMTLPVLLAH